MSLKVDHIDNYKNLGKAIRLTDGNQEIITPVDIGPRIMHFSLAGQHNILEDECPLTDDLPDGLGKFKIYGGHRNWHSPESFPRSYMPDNDPLESYEILDNGIKLIQKQEAWTQMKKSIELYFEADHVRVVNCIQNNNAWPIEMAVWGLTVGSRGGREILPVVQRNTGLLSNTGYRSWPYSRMNDPRAYWGQRYIVVDNDPADASSFKLGYLNEYAWTAYFNHGQCFVKRFGKPDRAKKYPDEGCNYETITTDWGIELESLSAMQIVQSGKTLTHEERWYVVESAQRPSRDEDEIHALMRGIADKVGIELPEVSSTAWDPHFKEEE